MKGIGKALSRTPHMLTTKVGMSKKSSDAAYDDAERKFAAVELASEKMLKDAVTFRDSVSNLLRSGTSFSGSLAILFSPMGSEFDLSRKFPQSEVTLNNITTYQAFMEELDQTLSPELELIQSRIVEPCKELNDICKKIRKTCVKRDHKLVDFDRHNNSLNKLRSKTEKSLKEEKNLYTVEQDFELASQEYEHYNELLKSEMPEFLAMAAAFIDPIFHSFYYMQLNIYYIMLEKIQSFTDGKYDLNRRDIEGIYFEQRGDTAEQLDQLQITHKGALHSTAKLRQMAGHSAVPSRQASTGSRGSYLDRRQNEGVGRVNSYSSKKDEAGVGGGYTPGAYAARQSGSPAAKLAPPPYTTTPSTDSIKKKAPPPPPPLKSKPSYGAPKLYATAIFDFEAQAEGDLSFGVGDRIEIIEKSDNADDWWTGKLNGRQGIFPGTYTQVDA